MFRSSNNKSGSGNSARLANSPSPFKYRITSLPSLTCRSVALAPTFAKARFNKKCARSSSSADKMTYYPPFEPTDMARHRIFAPLRAQPDWNSGETPRLLLLTTCPLGQNTARGESMAGVANDEDLPAERASEVQQGRRLNDPLPFLTLEIVTEQR